MHAYKMKFDAVYYEPGSLEYELGKKIHEKYTDIPWFPIKSHNNIEELRAKPNSEFTKLKKCLIVGTRKTHKYSDNQKISDYLVPFTSSGCTASCLYCYLVCNYNKCSYLRLFVNREEMFQKLCRFSYKTDIPKTFEIGSNSDLILENLITQNLEWVIPEFAQNGRGFLTFPTKFDKVDSLLSLEHKNKTIFRMSVNPSQLIKEIEIGTSPLDGRIHALNKMSEAGYPCGILIAPVILVDNWQQLYTDFIDYLEANISTRCKKDLTIEVIFMTYSYIHRAINKEAFPDAMDLFDSAKMTVRGRGKYRYSDSEKKDGEEIIREQLIHKFPTARLLYIC